MKQTPGIHVDVDELRAFADLLRSDLELGLKPGVSRAGHQIQQGVRFGLAAPGGQVAACCEVFAAALERARENTARQIRGAEILAAAIDQVVANYAEGDRIAASRLADLEHALLDAVRAAQALTTDEPPPPPAAGPQP